MSWRERVIGVIDANEEAVTVVLPLREAGQAVPPINGAVAIQLTGTFTGTLQFEASVDGVTFVPALSMDITTGDLGTTCTAPGVYRLESVGLSVVRVKSTAWSEGSANVTLVAAAG